MNGLAERAWQSIRDIAFSMMVHAHVGDEFYDFALDHAWKVYNCLPVRSLSKEQRPTTPYELFYDEKPNLRRFRVLFCSVVVNIGDKAGEKDPETGRSRVRQRKNTPERGVRGIHVGISSKSRGWLCYLPSTNNTVVSNDVYFDEQFHTTGSRHADRTRFAGGIPLQPHPQAITDGDQVEVVGTIYTPDQRGEDYSDESEDDPPIQNFGSLSLNSESHDALMDDAIEPVLPNDPNDAVYFDVEYAGHEAEMAPQPEDADILQNDPLSFDADDLEDDAQRWSGMKP